MRIDKFLKLSRIIKRRPVAKNILDIGLVQINSKVAKPSSEVKTGDILTLTLGQRILKVTVKETLQVANKKNCNEMFEIISDESINETSES